MPPQTPHAAELRDRVVLTVGNAIRRRLRRWDTLLARRLRPADQRQFARRLADFRRQRGY